MLVPLLVIIPLSASSCQFVLLRLSSLLSVPLLVVVVPPVIIISPLPPPTVSPILVVVTSLSIIVSLSFPCSLRCFHLLRPLAPHLLSHRFAPGVVTE